MRLLILFFLVLSCGKVNHSVSGDTQHSLAVEERICDKDTFPDRAERAECRMLLLRSQAKEGCKPEAE